MTNGSKTDIIDFFACRSSTAAASAEVNRARSREVRVEGVRVCVVKKNVLAFFGQHMVSLLWKHGDSIRVSPGHLGDSFHPPSPPSDNRCVPVLGQRTYKLLVLRREKIQSFAHKYFPRIKTRGFHPGIPSLAFCFSLRLNLKTIRNSGLHLKSSPGTAYRCVLNGNRRQRFKGSLGGQERFAQFQGTGKLQHNSII